MAEIWAGLYSLAAQRGDTGMSYVGRNESRTPAIQGVGLSTPTNYTNIMATLPQPPAWTEGAVCAQTDANLFFPERGESSREAKRVCAVCPVISECLAWALDTHENTGVWGGTTPRERRAVRRGAA